MCKLKFESLLFSRQRTELNKNKKCTMCKGIFSCYKCSAFGRFTDVMKIMIYT